MRILGCSQPPVSVLDCEIQQLQHYGNRMPQTNRHKPRHPERRGIEAETEADNETLADKRSPSILAQQTFPDYHVL